MKWLCWFLHDWSQWSQTKQESRLQTAPNGNMYRVEQLIQGRSCYRCGMINERLVRELSKIRVAFWHERFDLSEPTKKT